MNDKRIKFNFTEIKLRIAYRIVRIKEYITSPNSEDSPKEGENFYFTAESSDSKSYKSSKIPFTLYTAFIFRDNRNYVKYFTCKKDLRKFLQHYEIEINQEIGIKILNDKIEEVHKIITEYQLDKLSVLKRLINKIH